MSRTTMLTAAVVALTLATGAATAQTARTSGPLSGQPVMVGADGGEISDGANFALTGRAEVTQGDNRLRANTIVGRGQDGVLAEVTASGEVYYVTPNETIRGDRAVYTVANATIVVSGDVILTQGRNVLTGGRLTYNVDTGVARMDGGGRAQGRIQGVFYPDGN